MAIYHIQLTTEEIKTLQGILEDYIVTYHSDDAISRELLLKVTLAQLRDEDEGPTPAERAYTLDTLHHPKDSEDGVAF